MSPSSSIRDFAQYAGRFLWPRTTADLIDTTNCPACRTPLPAPICPSCGLDLRHPAARELLTASSEAAAALDKRVQLIGQIRYEVAAAESTAAAAQQRALEQVAAQAEIAERTAAERTAAERRAAALAATEAAAQATRATLASAPPASPTVPDPTMAAAPTLPPFAAPGSRGPAAATQPAATPPGSATPPPAAEVPAGPAPHKRSSVQIVLLLVGVTLVSVAAIFFVTVAFIFTGLAFRASVVAVVTLGTLVTAALLRRKGLAATAEGIGALAVVLVLLDIWAMRRLNLFGLADADGLLYWGGALAVCTVLFLAWHAASSLRVASVAGFAAAAPAVGLLAAGIAADAAPITRLFVAFVGAATGALLHRFTLPGTAGFWPVLDRVAERVALLTVAVLALATATGLAGFVQPATDWAPLVSFGVVAVVAAAHAVIVLSRPQPDALSRVAAHASVSLAVLAAVLGVAACIVRTENLDLLLSVPLLVAVTIALALELAWRRRAAGPVRRAVLTGAVTALGLAGMAGFAALGTATIPLIRALIARDVDPIAPFSSEATAALAALAGVAVLVTGFWRVGGVLTARRPLLAWFGTIVLLLAVPFTQWLWLILPLYLLLGALALTALFRSRAQRPALAGFRPQLVATFAAAETLGYAIGWTTSSSWWVGTVSAVGALILARYLLNPQAGANGRGALLAGAIVLTLVGAAAAPPALTLAAPPADAVLLLHIVLAVGITTGVLQLLIARGRLARLGVIERRWAFWTLLVPTLYVAVAPTGRLIEALSSDERATIALLAPALGILSAALVLAAALIWTLAPTDRLRWERFTAALLVAPALYSLAANLVLVTGAPATIQRLIVPTATLLTVALALALRVTGRSTRAGIGLEIGAAGVLATALLPSDRVELGWLVLLFTGVAVLLTAVDADGLFASNSWRRHLGWLSLVLATAGLWWGLFDGGTTPVEAYVLPVAGTVLALAALLWRYGKVDRTVAASPGAALLTFAGLSLALLPLSITGYTGAVARPLIVGAVAAALLIGATLVRWTAPRWAFLAAAGLAGALALSVTAIARSIAVLNAVGPTGPLLEAWLLPATAILVAGALLLVRRSQTGFAVVRNRSSLTLVLVALVTLTALEIAAFDGSSLGSARAIGLVLLLSVLHVLALRLQRVPFGTLTAWASAALAAVAAGAALVVDAVDPFEVALVPLGLALVAGQLLQNRPWSSGAGRAAPAAHYWIGAGLALVLLPSAVVAAGPGATTLAGTGLTDDAVRQLLTLLLGGVLAVGGAAVADRPRWSLLAWPAVLVGSVGIVLTAAGRLYALLATDPTGPDWRLEAWLVPAALLLVTAGGLVIRAFPAAPENAAAANAAGLPSGAVTGAVTGAADAGPGIPRSIGYGLVVLALLGILLAETTALFYTPYADARAFALIGLFAALHVLLRWLDRSRAGTLLAWFTIAAGALALVAGLGRNLIDPIELGTIPLGLALVAGELIALGLLGRRPAQAGSGAAGVAPAPSRVAGQAALASGLAIALLPSAVVGAEGALVRPVLSLTLGGAVGIVGALLLIRPRWSILAWPASIVGVLAVLVTVGLRIVPLYDGPAGPTGALEGWLILAALLLVAIGACLVWTTWVTAPRAGAGAPVGAPLTGPADSGVAPRTGTDRAVTTGYGLIIAALVGVVLAEAPALDYAPLAMIRVVLVVWLFSALYLGVFWADESRPGRLVAWVAIGGAAVMVIAGWTHDVPDPVEIVSIPLALALVASGLLHLDRTPAARSWTTLAPGLLVLLLPSLFLDLTYSPLWRVVGLGVLAILVLVLGTVRRLQAPFLIGAVVLLVHALAQLWPWISLAYGVVPWWLWLGIGGVLLIVLAARYEQRIQNLKSVALKISTLR